MDQNQNNINDGLDGLDSENKAELDNEEVITEDVSCTEDVPCAEDVSCPEDVLAAKGGKAPSGILVAALDVIEIFALSLAFVLLIFSFCFRLCRVDGDSMNNTLRDGELLITSNMFYTPEGGDVVVFHLSNDSFKKPLVKRVIATAGQTVTVNFTSGEVRVDSQLIDEDYVFLEGGEYDISPDFDRRYIHHVDGDFVYEITVPDGKVFVMGDNRNNSSDSRSGSVGLVDTDTILGKALFRISPFTSFD